MSGRTPVLDDDGDRSRGAGEEKGGSLVMRLEILEIVVGSAICAVAVWFWIAAADIEDTGEAGIGPPAFPRGLALLLGSAALVLAGRAGVRLASGRSEMQSVTERPLHVLAGMALVAAFPAVMTRLGYYPAMGLLVPSLLWVAGYRKPLGIVLYTAGFLAFTKVVFGVILKVPLP